MLKLEPESVVAFTAEVVDLVGDGVPGEQVVAEYFFGDGSVVEARITTDGWGRADFVATGHGLQRVELTTRHGGLIILEPTDLARAVIEV